jgi:cytoskeletal protein RodZ
VSLASANTSGSAFAFPWALLVLVILLAGALYGWRRLGRGRRRAHQAEIALAVEQARKETERRLLGGSNGKSGPTSAFESTKSDASGAKPAASGPKPAASGPKPTKPAGSTTAKPPASTTRPAAPAAKPPASTTRPAAPAAKPPASTTRPAAPAAKPPASTTRPAAPAAKSARSSGPTQADSLNGVSQPE